MPSLVEEPSNEETVPQGSALSPPRGNLERLRRTSAAAISSLGLTRAVTVSGHEVGTIEDQVVDLLDVIGMRNTCPAGLFGGRN